MSFTLLLAVAKFFIQSKLLNCFGFAHAKFPFSISFGNLCSISACVFMGPIYISVFNLNTC